MYLTDVHVEDEAVDAQAFPVIWEDAFRRSAWFSRGWTLQELLAPATVEFFAANGKYLGSKISLEQEIHEITSIPTRALRKYRLEEFSVGDRMSWAKMRRTTVEEDKAYCLLGIFGVFLPPIPGEGEEYAMRRLWKEIEAQNNPVSRRGGSLWTFEESHAACLRSLGFSPLQARQNDVAPAHPNTCDWLFKTTKFCKWRDQNDLADYNGVLWLKGKPGAGKSTLMKHALHYCKQEFGNSLVVAYFFNVRGEQLEKTALGLLRSIVYQLMEGDDNIRDRFIIRYNEKQMMHEAGKLEWRLLDLRDFVLSEIKQRHLKSTLLLVDALDECIESNMRDVVDMLETLSIEAVQSKTTLRICLSSRHYPSIGMKKKLELIVDNNKEHHRDIVKYIDDKLEAGNNHIRYAIQEKADGMFLWAVLVVALVNKATRAGRIEEIQKTLDDLPGDLEGVFETMLAKDGTRKDETVLMLQWVLFSPRPLKPEELFRAVMTKINPQLIEPWDPAKLTDKVIRRRITDSSKGFVEIRPGIESTVQFIHPSVNEFLLRHRRLPRLEVSETMLAKDGGPKKDFGYTSASGPDLSRSSELAAQRYERSLAPASELGKISHLYNDIQSLPSNNDEDGSQASVETSNEEISGKALIRIFLCEEPQFRLLCDKAFARMDEERFVKNLLHLLKSFHDNLSVEAKSEAEKSIARLLRSKRGRLRISRQLANHIRQERSDVPQDDRVDLRIPTKNLNRVENWLKLVSDRPADSWAEGKTVKVGSESATSASTNDSEEDEFPNVSKLKTFLRGSRSFRLLLKDCMMMFLPFELRRVLLSISKKQIWLSSEQDSSILNRFKAWVEQATQARWIWWPFEPPKRVLSDNESRIFWRCVSLSILLTYQKLNSLSPAVSVNGKKYLPNSMDL